MWRKIIFGWKFDGTRFLLSTYPTPESRIRFHRNVSERVRAIAPFLSFDPDPYIVLVDGRMYWIVDAYTTSKYYPYSEPYDSDEVIEYSEGNRTRQAFDNYCRLQGEQRFAEAARELERLHGDLRRLEKRFGGAISEGVPDAASTLLPTPRE